MQINSPLGGDDRSVKTLNGRTCGAITLKSGNPKKVSWAPRRAGDLRGALEGVLVFGDCVTKTAIGVATSDPKLSAPLSILRKVGEGNRSREPGLKVALGGKN